MKPRSTKALVALALVSLTAVLGCDGSRPARPPLTPVDIDERPFDCSAEPGCIRP